MLKLQIKQGVELSTCGFGLNCIQFVHFCGKLLKALKHRDLLAVK